jgi:hypothetical protein
MSLAPQTRDVVVLGRFNPHIINPEWLKKQEICEGADVKVLFGFNMDDQRGEFRFSIGKFKWQVTDARLSIGTTDGNPSELAAAVIDKLPHTPLSAIGHNFSYRMDADAEKRLRVPQLGELDRTGLAENRGTVRQTSWSCIMELANALLNMKVVQRDNSLEVTTNLHRDVSDPAKIKELAHDFEKDVQLSNRMVSSIVGPR